ncbi:hypothetical protein P154DRAFT_440659, partial [Amniculicola lignicola CBS 123094]
VCICDDINWTGNCRYITACIGGHPSNCVVLDGSASSIGPDPGWKCYFYENALCHMSLQDPASVLVVRYPGLRNLVTDRGDWNDRVRSYNCFEDL